MVKFIITQIKWYLLLCTSRLGQNACEYTVVLVQLWIVHGGFVNVNAFSLDSTIYYKSNKFCL